MNNRARAGKGLLAALLAAILFAAACAPIVRPPGEPINRPLLAGDFFHTADGLVLREIGIFVRSPAELVRARQTAEDAGLPYKLLDDKVETTSGYLSISTMHLAKGLEFRAVVVVPLLERIETVADETELEDVYNTERHLLYVACTRARDYLLLTSGDSASEFLDDLRE